VGGSETLRMIYITGPAHQARLIDRPSLFVGPTVCGSALFPLLILLLPLPPRLYQCSRARASSSGPAYTCVRCCAGEQQAGDNTMRPTRGRDKIGAQTAVSRTPAGTHAFFAHNPLCVYGSASLSPSPSATAAHCYYQDGRRAVHPSATLYLRKSDS